MRWNELEDEACSVARTLAVIGDRWTLLVLRECFMGVRRFEQFQSRLHISRTILRDRLNHLVSYAILERCQYEQRPPRHEYRLTEAGQALHPVMVTIAQWGDAHMADASGPPVVRRHRPCGHRLQALLTCAECGEPVAPRDVAVQQGPDDPGSGDRGPARPPLA